MDFLGHIFTHLVVRIDFACLAQSDLLVRVLHVVIFHNDTVAIDFAVPLFGVYDNVKVFVRAENFGNHAVKALFEHTDHGSDVDMLVFLEICKGFDETHRLSLFFSHV